MRSRKGQSILEYVIVLTAIVAAIAFAASNVLRTSVESAVSDAGDAIESSSTELLTGIGF